MALFSRKTKKADVETPTTATAPVVSTRGNHTAVLARPRITEKASMAMEGSTYVFDISPRATKREVMKAVETIYKVKPRKVTIVNIHAKTTRNMRTGQTGIKGGYKKAYVHLQKGETITIA